MGQCWGEWREGAEYDDRSDPPGPSRWHTASLYSERRSIWLLSRAHPLFASTRRAAPGLPLHSGIAVGRVESTAVHLTACRLTRHW